MGAELQACAHLQCNNSCCHDAQKAPFAAASALAAAQCGEGLLEYEGMSTMRSEMLKLCVHKFVHD